MAVAAFALLLSKFRIWDSKQVYNGFSLFIVGNYTPSIAEKQLRCCQRYVLN